MKLRISDESTMIIVYTKNIYAQEDIDKMREIITSIDWVNDKCVILPSEYIKKIKLKKR